ncbi:MAG: bifunctional glutamate N-acetyltransferase/amino-acid acetyltransferase ArgJ, partial [Bdellovibrionales bacterium]|nr:bifunctional glutamate N-acetyltransferase/amino-acid acetyltransferase ArgJ [Bdellovibrionales bacterium]
LLALEPEQVAVASTGIIGVQLPMETLLTGLDSLLRQPRAQDGVGAAEAIMTTDLVRKEVFLERQIGGTSVAIAGMAKGSGMIAPNMGTMLAYLALSVPVPQELLQELFAEACDASFNMVSVDSDTSTSDMALLFATGNQVLSFDRLDIRAPLAALVTEACVELAKMIARDGEGAEKLIEVRVRNATTLPEARRIALNIVNSPLVKTAVHGGDPNWGRIAMAVGKDPSVTVDPDRVDLFFGNEQVFRQGAPLPQARERVRKELAGPEVIITADLNLGAADAVAWGCDLTKRYVDINVDYS